MDLEPETRQARLQMSRTAHGASEEKATSSGKDGRGALAQSTGEKGRRAEIHAHLLCFRRCAKQFPRVHVTTKWDSRPVKQDL